MGQIHAVLGLFQHCFSHVRSRPTFDQNMRIRCHASGCQKWSEMLEQRIRGYSQNRPKTSVKQPFYREYSQYKVKYLLFWPYSSKNHSHSSKNRYRSFEHVSRRNGRIRVFGQNDPKRVNSSKKRPKTPVFGLYTPGYGPNTCYFGLFWPYSSKKRSNPGIWPK